MSASPPRVQLSIGRTADGGVEVSVSLPPVQDEAARGKPINPSWSWLSPLTSRVVRLMCGVGWMPREEIAAKLGEKPDGKLSDLLTDLVERNILESSPRKGYHLGVPENADPEAYRAKLLVWLELHAPG